MKRGCLWALGCLFAPILLWLALLYGALSLGLLAGFLQWLAGAI